MDAPEVKRRKSHSAISDSNDSLEQKESRKRARDTSSIEDPRNRKNFKTHSVGSSAKKASPARSATPSHILLPTPDEDHDQECDISSRLVKKDYNSKFENEDDNLIVKPGDRFGSRCIPFYRLCFAIFLTYWTFLSPCYFYILFYHIFFLISNIFITLKSHF